MSINSQPLFFAFSQSFGVQTLGVSGRYMFINAGKVPLAWKLFRIITSLDNNKTPLRLSSLFDASVWEALFVRRASMAAKSASNSLGFSSDIPFGYWFSNVFL